MVDDRFINRTILTTLFRTSLETSIRHQDFGKIVYLIMEFVIKTKRLKLPLKTYRVVFCEKQNLK